jgi:hypothetical protein
LESWFATAFPIKFPFADGELFSCNLPEIRLWLP